MPGGGPIWFGPGSPWGPGAGSAPTPIAAPPVPSPGSGTLDTGSGPSQIIPVSGSAPIPLDGSAAEPATSGGGPSGMVIVLIGVGGVALIAFWLMRRGQRRA